MQFPWGSVSAIRPPLNRRLTDLTFRTAFSSACASSSHPVRSTTSSWGKRTGIPFVKVGESTAERRPLLKPVPDALDQLLWKLDIESDPPRLLVNKDAQPTWKEMARSPDFIALVYPEVLRQLLSYTLLIDLWVEDDEDTGWETDWIRFARNVGGLPAPPPPADREGRQGWIDEAVSAFARRHQLKLTWDLNFEEENTDETTPL